jgi:hypothetical protein
VFEGDPVLVAQFVQGVVDEVGRLVEPLGGAAQQRRERQVAVAFPAACFVQDVQQRGLQAGWAVGGRPIAWAIMTAVSKPMPWIFSISS